VRGAGAEVVGGDELVASIQEAGGSGLPFDKCLATADMMPRLAKIARILGPRGMMPNPKLGTIVAPGGLPAAIAATKAGRVEYRCARALTLTPPGSHATVLHAGACQALCSGRRACPPCVPPQPSTLPNWRPRGTPGVRFRGRAARRASRRGDCGCQQHNSVRQSQSSARTHRADKGGVLHAAFGRVSFADAALRENFAALVTAVVAARPKKAKGNNFGGYVTKARVGPPPFFTALRFAPNEVLEDLKVSSSAKCTKHRLRTRCWLGSATSRGPILWAWCSAAVTSGTVQNTAIAHCARSQGAWHTASQSRGPAQCYTYRDAASSAHCRARPSKPQRSRHAQRLGRRLGSAARR